MSWHELHKRIDRILVRAHVEGFKSEAKARAFAAKLRALSVGPKVEHVGSEWIVSTAYRHYDLLSDIVSGHA